MFAEMNLSNGDVSQVLEKAITAIIISANWESPESFGLAKNDIWVCQRTMREINRRKALGVQGNVCHSTEQILQYDGSINSL